MCTMQYGFGSTLQGVRQDYYLGESEMLDFFVDDTEPVRPMRLVKIDAVQGIIADTSSTIKSKKPIKEWMHDTFQGISRAKQADKSASQPNWQLNVLMTTLKKRRNESDEQLLPLPFCDDAFRLINSTFHLSSSFLEILQLSSQVFVETPEPVNADSPRIKTFVFQRSQCMVGNFCASIHYDPYARTTLCFVHGLDADEQAALVTRLQDLSSLCLLPTLVPALLLELIELAARGIQSGVQSTIAEVESKTGLGPEWWLARQLHQAATGRDESPTRLMSKMDFPRLIHDITGAATKTGYQEYRCRSYFPILDALAEVGRRVAREAAGADSEELTAAEGNLRIFLSRMRVVFTSILERSEYHATRLRIQRETVYSLIAQRDADASLRVARATQKDGEAMREMTGELKKENASIHFLQIVAMTFLPATFLASIFSTTFFDFQAADQPSVSIWILWVYVTPTVLLTVVVYMVWLRTRRSHLPDDVESGLVDDASCSVGSEQWAASGTAVELTSMPKFRP